MPEPALTAREAEWLLDQDEAHRLEHGTLLRWVDLAYDLYHDPEFGQAARALGPRLDAQELLQELSDIANEDDERPYLDSHSRLVLAQPDLEAFWLSTLQRAPDAEPPEPEGRILEEPDAVDVTYEIGPPWLVRWLSIQCDELGITTADVGATAFDYIEKLVQDEPREAAPIRKAEALDRKMRRRPPTDAEIVQMRDLLVEARLKIAESGDVERRRRAVGALVRQGPRSAEFVKRIMGQVIDGIIVRARSRAN